jgi:plasmid stabilization system protein ParE
VSRYVFGRYVEGDLREIRDYIAKDSPESARRMMIRFVSAFRLLAKQPELGHAREDLWQAAIRFWPVGAYLILYLALRTPIEILAVVHGARDVPAIVNRRAQ